MQLICGQDAAVAEWVRSRLACMKDRDFGPCAAIGVADDDGALIAGVVYHAYRPDPVGGDIEMSIAATSARWCRRGVLRALFHYPFIQVGCHRITAVTADGNTQAQRLSRGLGFEVEGRIRRGFGAEDAIIMGLLRDEAGRWLGE